MRNSNKKCRNGLGGVVRVILFLFLLTSCYNHGQKTPDAWDLTKEQLDSISFSTTHHYTQGYNFVVNVDSLQLLESILITGDAVEVLAEDGTEAISQDLAMNKVIKGDRLVVADIDIVPSDSIDSVWVKVAHDQLTQGWIRESELLCAVSPDDPISEFIDFFSDSHLLIFLTFSVIVGAGYGLFRLNRRNAHIVHFRDIGSLYPTLLCLLVAASATLYASIQMFGPETWRHFYYHPSLNPFTLPPILGLFLTSVWAIVIVAVAVVIDLYRRLPLGDAILYLGGLAAVCAVDYVVFSLTTLYYVGYVLLVAYVVFALWRYIRFSYSRYRCGQCGYELPTKGICPHCGTLNE